MAPFRMQERDLDLFVLEELHADTEFADWLAIQIDLSGYRFIEAEHSVSARVGAKWGETDVLAFFEGEAGRVAVLIEDKIAASFQDRQAERYRERACDLVEKKRANLGRTVLIAPQTYLNGVPRDDSWDHRISIDDIAEWFSKKEGSHAVWRTSAIRTCIQRNRQIVSPRDGSVVQFSNQFSQLLTVITGGFSHISQRTENTWGLFIKFAGQVTYISIAWKLNQNCVDLILEKHHVGKIQAIPNQIDIILLPKEETGFKCDILRIAVGSASWSDPMSEQLDVIGEVITACERLRVLAIQIASMPSIIQKAPELP